MKVWRWREKLVLATIIFSCGLVAHSEPPVRGGKTVHPKGVPRQRAGDISVLAALWQPAEVGSAPAAKAGFP